MTTATLPVDLRPISALTKSHLGSVTVALPGLCFDKAKSHNNIDISEEIAISNSHILIEQFIAEYSSCFFHSGT